MKSLLIALFLIASFNLIAGTDTIRIKQNENAVRFFVDYDAFAGFYATKPLVNRQSDTPYGIRLNFGLRKRFAPEVYFALNGAMSVEDIYNEGHFLVGLTGRYASGLERGDIFLSTSMLWDRDITSPRTRRLLEFRAGQLLSRHLGAFVSVGFLDTQEEKERDALLVKMGFNLRHGSAIATTGILALLTGIVIIAISGSI